MTACAHSTQAGVLSLHPRAPYRGGVVGRSCAPHLPLLDLRAAGCSRLPASFGSRVKRAVLGAVLRPMLASVWPDRMTGAGLPARAFFIFRGL